MTKAEIRDVHARLVRGLPISEEVLHASVEELFELSEAIVVLLCGRDEALEAKKEEINELEGKIEDLETQLGEAERAPKLKRERAPKLKRERKQKVQQ